MLRFYARLILLPLAFLTVVLLLIHAQPYDDHQARELHTLLPPQGCPAPCFMGIRPGVTTTQEAMTLLKNHAWVAQVIPINPEKPYQVWWTWSENAPDYLRNTPTNPNFPVNGEVDSYNDIVSNISFDPGLTVSDIALTWGLPVQSQLIFGGVLIVPDPSIPAITAMPYEARGFWASGSTLCPYAAHVWDTPVRLGITDKFHEMSLGTVYPISRATFVSSIRQISTMICGV